MINPPAPITHAPLTHAMVLAAGLGLRMRPITEHTPKPLVAVGGRPMLDRVLDHLDQAGVSRKIVNAHWLAQQIHDHLARRADVTVSDESDALLETGGGVKRALPLLGDQPFFVCNADIVWRNGSVPALTRLAEAWDPERMDSLLLLHRTASTLNYAGKGDFFLDSQGHVRRRLEKEVSPYLYTGVQIIHPRLFADAPDGKFSLNLLWNQAADAGRLFGIVHDGEWYEVGTPQALAEIESVLAETD